MNIVVIFLTITYASAFDYFFFSGYNPLCALILSDKSLIQFLVNGLFSLPFGHFAN